MLKGINFVSEAGFLESVKLSFQNKSFSALILKVNLSYLHYFFFLRTPQLFMPLVNGINSSERKKASVLM